MKDGAKEFGAQVEMRRNPRAEPAGQIRRLEDVLSLPDVQGVAISVLEAESPGIADKMRDLQKAGKVVIAIDSDGQKDARRAYIGTNNRKAGEVAGKVARVLAAQGRQNGRLRRHRRGRQRQGAPRGLLARGRTRRSRRTRARSSRTGPSQPGQTNVQTAISKYPDVGVFLGLWSYNAHFIAEEVAKFPELRKKATVVTFDLDELAVDDLAKGAIDATVCQNPYQMGYLGVRLLEGARREGPEDDRRDAPRRHRHHRHRRPRDRADKDSPVKGDNVIDIER